MEQIIIPDDQNAGKNCWFVNEMLCWTFSFFQNMRTWFGYFGSWLYSHLQTAILTILTVLMLSLDQWRLLGSTPGRFGVLFKQWDERCSVTQNVPGSIPALPLVLNLGCNMHSGFFFSSTYRAFLIIIEVFHQLIG